MLTPTQIEAIEKEAISRYPENILPAGKDTARKQRRNQEAFIEGAKFGKTSGIEEAEGIAIAFNEWCFLNYEPCSDNTNFWWENSNRNIFTPKELFSLFIKQYLKKQYGIHNSRI